MTFFSFDFQPRLTFLPLEISSCCSIQPGSNWKRDRLIESHSHLRSDTNSSSSSNNNTARLIIITNAPHSAKQSQGSLRPSLVQHVPERVRGEHPRPVEQPPSLNPSSSSSCGLAHTHRVPLYGNLLQLVAKINSENDSLLSQPEKLRLRAERHGAIRLGTPAELRLVARMFKLLGMHPVGYYGLSC